MSRLSSTFHKTSDSPMFMISQEPNTSTDLASFPSVYQYSPLFPQEYAPLTSLPGNLAKAVFVTIVASTAGGHMSRLQPPDSACRNKKKRIHNKNKKAGDPVTRLVHATLFAMCKLWCGDNLQPWVATFESGAPERQGEPSTPADLFHVHVVLGVDAITTDRVRDYYILLSYYFRDIGRAYVERCDPTGTSGHALANYLSKRDATADSIMEKAYPGTRSRTFFSFQPPQGVPSRIVPCASWSLSKLFLDHPDIFPDRRFHRREDSLSILPELANSNF